jgi:hypothetical protein
MNEKQIFPSFGGVAKGRGGWPDVLICALFLFALLSSCKQDNQTNSLVVQGEVVQDDKIGILHNQLLDTIYNDLWKEKVAAYMSGDAVKQAKRMTAGEKESLQNRQVDLAYNSLRRGMKNLLPDVTDAEIDAYMSKGKFDAGVSQKKLSLASPDDNSSNNELQHLTPFQQKYYEELMQRINSKGASLEQVLVQIAELEVEIVKNSPTRAEAEQLLQVTSVARYSTQYWAENINKWIMLNSEVVGVLEELPAAQPGQKTAIIRQSAPPQEGLMPPGSFPLFPPGTYPYPDPDYPDWYVYVPDNGPGAPYTPYAQHCPIGMLYDPLLCICNFPDVVNNSDFWGAFTGADTGGAVAGIKAGWQSALLCAASGSAIVVLSSLFTWLFS